MAPRAQEEHDGPNPVDIHVGQKVRDRRLMLGLSQHELAEAINLTFQQVQKYERGTNRISASRLYEIAKVLRVPVESFFEGISAGRKQIKGFAESKQAAFEAAPDPYATRETLELVRAYSEIDDPKLKRQLLEMARIMGKPRKKRGKG